MPQQGILVSGSFSMRSPNLEVNKLQALAGRMACTKYDPRNAFTEIRLWHDVSHAERRRLSLCWKFTRAQEDNERVNRPFHDHPEPKRCPTPSAHPSQ